MASRKVNHSGLNISPQDGGNAILAAWQGLYWLFGARVDRFEISEDGVSAIGLKFNDGINPEEIISGLTNNHRLDLISLYPYLMGQEPPKFENAHDMTTWMTRFYKSGQGVRSPQFVKDAITSYKIEQGIAATRGRPRKIVKLDFSNLSAESLANVPEEEQQKLKEVLDSLLPEKTEEAPALA